MIPRDWFIALGVPVFPIMAGTKKPDVPAGDSWINWQGRVADADRYGVPLGTGRAPLCVVDADSARSNVWVRANCPATPFRVQTGPYHDSSDKGRGVHFYYRIFSSVEYPAKIRRDGLEIEFRRAGQYVLGPASRHPSGCTYRVTDWSWSIDDVPFFPADFDFNGGTGITSPEGEPYVAPEVVMRGDGRVPAMFKHLRHLKANGTDEATARFLMWRFNLDRCDPPRWVPTREVIIENGLSSGQGRPAYADLDPFDDGWPGLRETRETIAALKERRALLVEQQPSNAETAERIREAENLATDIRKRALALIAPTEAAHAAVNEAARLCLAVAEETWRLFEANTALDKLSADADILRPETRRLDAPTFPLAALASVILSGFFRGGQPGRVDSNLVPDIRAAQAEQEADPIAN